MPLPETVLTQIYQGSQWSVKSQWKVSEFETALVLATLSLCSYSITVPFHKYNRHLASITAQQLAKFQNNMSILTPNPTVLKLHVLPYIETGTTSFYPYTIPCHHCQQFVIIDTDRLVNNSPSWRSINLRIVLIDLVKICVLFFNPIFSL